MSLDKFKWLSRSEYLLKKNKKTLHSKMLHCCEAPRSMLSNYFCTKQVFRGTFGEIWRIQIQIYPNKYVELKNGAFYLNKEVSAHRLGLVVQLSWRVAPPYNSKTFFFESVGSYLTKSKNALSIAFSNLAWKGLGFFFQAKKLNFLPNGLYLPTKQPWGSPKFWFRHHILYIQLKLPPGITILYYTIL